jgi:hypothetical protein
MASEMFDFPHPLGPTIAVTPGKKLSVVLSANDLNPNNVRLFKYMLSTKYRIIDEMAREKTTIYCVFPLAISVPGRRKRLFTYPKNKY